MLSQHKKARYAPRRIGTRHYYITNFAIQNNTVYEPANFCSSVERQSCVIGSFNHMSRFVNRNCPSFNNEWKLATKSLIFRPGRVLLKSDAPCRRWTVLTTPPPMRYEKNKLDTKHDQVIFCFFFCYGSTVSLLVECWDILAHLYTSRFHYSPLETTKEWFGE